MFSYVFSPSLTYEEIVNQSYDRLKCDYENCGKSFYTQTRLDSHIRRRHAVEDNTQSGEPIDRSSHVRHQSLSAALGGRQQIPTITTTSLTVPTITTTTTTSSADSQWLDIKYNNLITSSDIRDQSKSRAPDGRQQMQAITTTDPSLTTIITTSSPDSQSMDNKRDNVWDSDIELIGRVPAFKRPARNRSPVDIKPSLIDSIPLVSETVNQSPIDIKPVIISTSPRESSTVHNSPFSTTTTGAGNERSHELASDIHRFPESNASNVETPVPSTTATTISGSGPTVASSERPYKCDKCGQSYGRDRELKQHRELRHGVRESYPCDQCDRQYEKESQLAAHMRHNHRARDRRYRCPYAQCERRFESPELLEEHRLRAHRHYRCDYKPCVMTYTTSHGLRAHQQWCWYRSDSRRTPSRSSSHRSTDRIYRCNVCPVKYTTRALLYDHTERAHKRRSVTLNRGPVVESESADRSGPVIDTNGKEVADRRTAGEETPAVVSHTSVAAPLETAHNNSQISDSIELNDKSVVTPDVTHQTSTAGLNNQSQ
ncbi:unnamed protein product, partial [Medioppia subpectinata]